MKLFKNEISVSASLATCHVNLRAGLAGRNCSFKKTTSKLILSTIVVLFVCAFGYTGISQAKSVKLNQDECQTLTTTDKTYISSVQRVMKLSTVKTWMSLLDKNMRRLAIGTNVDKPVFEGGRCFWSISLYESDESKLQLWREYLVEINGSKIHIAN